MQVFAAPLKGGDRALLLFNRQPLGDATVATVTWRSLGLPPGTPVATRNLFRGVTGDRGNVTAHGVTVAVEADSCVLLRVVPDIAAWCQSTSQLTETQGYPFGTAAWRRLIETRGFGSSAWCDGRSRGDRGLHGAEWLGGAPLAGALGQAGAGAASSSASDGGEDPAQVPTGLWLRGGTAERQGPGATELLRGGHAFHQQTTTRLSTGSLQGEERVGAGLEERHRRCSDAVVSRLELWRPWA